MDDKPPDSPSSFRERFAARLEADAVAVTDGWIERAARRPELSLDALRDHIPGFLRDLAEGIRKDEVPVRSRASHADYLRMHVEQRLKHGYSLDQLLEEFSALPLILHEVIDDLAASRPPPPLPEVNEVHRRMQREVGRVGRVAARLYRQAEMEERRRLAERLTSFSRTLEHEIREPLHRAMAAADRLEAPDALEDPDAHSENVHVLRKGLERMADLLTDVRRLTAVEKSFAEEEWAPARETITDIFDELDTMARSKAVELRLGEIAEDIYVRVPRVRLAARNLVANAIQYSDPEEENRYVEVSLHPPSGGPFKLVIQDNGRGVPEELLEEIFEPGVRARPQAESGSGLGLAITQQVLEQRGGSVSLERTAEGSRFILRLPATLAEKKS